MNDPPRMRRCRLGGSPRSPGEVNTDVQVEVFGQEMLEFAAFNDAQPVVADREGLGLGADPRGGDKHAR